MKISEMEIYCCARCGDVTPSQGDLCSSCRSETYIAQEWKHPDDYFG